MNKIPPSVLKEALRLLGTDTEADSGLLDDLKRAYAQLLEVSKPRTVYKKTAVRQTENGVLLDGTEFVSKDLKKLFSNSSHAFILAATLGAETDTFLRRKMIENMADAALLDACANAETERVCDTLEQQLSAEISGGEYLTKRFSPGYGDVDLEYSSVLVNILNAQKAIGLACTASKMLVPSKSVTAFIGISAIKEDRRRRCDECAANTDCVWKKRGERCGV